MTKRKRIYGDAPRVGRDRSGPAPPRGRSTAPPPRPAPPGPRAPPGPQAPPRGRSTAPPGSKPAPDRTTPPRVTPTLAPKPKTSSLLERAAGEGAITDAEGLELAYAQGDAYTHGTTTYIAGSHTQPATGGTM